MRAGERIDFFLTHSWHDDPIKKFQIMQQVAATFMQKHQHEPSFWLDKACIDQENLADDLRVLPVSVMACNVVLATCGSTYVHRLWCIWELFVLLAFLPLEAVMERLHVVAMEAEKDEGEYWFTGKLRCFDVADAHCYDPNEEARLRSVIDALGASNFNAKIHNLGGALERRKQRSARKMPLSQVLGSLSLVFVAAAMKSGTSSSLPEIRDTSDSQGGARGRHDL